MSSRRRYRVVYFDFKGRGELIRLILASAGEIFEDMRLEYSPNSTEWLEYKPLTPFGKLPVLEIIEKRDEDDEDDDDRENSDDESVDEENVKRIAQSITIARYLANQLDLNGENEWEKVEADMYADQISEVADKIVEFHLETDPDEQKRLMNKLDNQILPFNLKLLENRIKKINSGYLIGNSLSWVDLYLFSVLEWLGMEKKVELLDRFPIIKEHDEKIQSNDRIAKWLRKRPDSKY